MFLREGFEMRHLTSLFSLCGLLILVSAVTANRLRAAEREAQGPLYPLQAELESKLQGTPEERREYAALFPMRMLLDMPAPSALARGTMRSYLGHAACFIDTEAPGRLPLLKRLLNLDSKHLYRPNDGAGVADEHLSRLA
jgi:hypothetical protein